MPFRTLPPLLIACLIPAAVVGQPASPEPAAWRPIVEGRLANGLRYAILPRRANEPGLGLLMRIDDGFLAERRPGERGLAHLIEHVAFASPTTGFPDEPNHFPRHGLPLSFPAPTAASTSWRETNYFVSTRTAKPADLDTLLGLFREIATDLTFRPDTVDAQRADVLREMAEKKPGNMIYADYIRAMAPGSPTDVIDAQNSDDVPTASVATIRALYQRLYRPERAMIVIVGDVDPAVVKPLIERRFGSWHGVGPAPRTPVPTFDRARIAPVSHSARKDGRTSVMIGVAMPTPAPARDPRRAMQATLMDMVAVRAVNARLAQPGAPQGKTGLHIENGEQGHRLFLLWDNVAPGQWRGGLVALRRTACALRTRGFSPAAWTQARAAVLGDLAQRTQDMPAAANVELAKDLSHALAGDRTLVAPDRLLAYALAWLPTVDAATANAWWRGEWRRGTEHVRVESPELAGISDPQATIGAAVAEADAGCAAPS